MFEEIQDAAIREQLIKLLQNPELKRDYQFMLARHPKQELYCAIRTVMLDAMFTVASLHGMTTEKMSDIMQGILTTMDFTLKTRDGKAVDDFHKLTFFLSNVPDLSQVDRNIYRDYVSLFPAYYLNRNEATVRALKDAHARMLATMSEFYLGKIPIKDLTTFACAVCGAAGIEAYFISQTN